MALSIYTFGGFYDDPSEVAHRAEQKADKFLSSNNIQREQIVAMNTSLQSTFIERDLGMRIDFVITLIVDFPDKET